jgi:hypothetical protein
LALKWPKKRPPSGFQELQNGCMQGACAASNACKVAPNDGKAFVQNKTPRQLKVAILAHFLIFTKESKLKFLILPVRGAGLARAKN